LFGYKGNAQTRGDGVEYRSFQIDILQNLRRKAGSLAIQRLADRDSARRQAFFVFDLNAEGLEVRQYFVRP
jgi:hypothetical protein